MPGLLFRVFFIGVSITLAHGFATATRRRLGRLRFRLGWWLGILPYRQGGHIGGRNLFARYVPVGVNRRARVIQDAYVLGFGVGDLEH
ncbi:hypothetical protein F4815DRAFT_488358 [Daldinia loculata]|uniref:uncharacterized protein n=1 Tax=Daldinia loculata TaxID=103429 RepID=UPI0020C4161B|nr:uncharacterized protein F4817DRAFT_354389 [Daldinia loculata]KAI1641946.1 hypothetical protein F4817DRAFT_354389 [Daldinia loculata]KAI2773235.1 hypothetical protein F4815DRAFT_488358 [Daldinia loculata]